MNNLGVKYVLVMSFGRTSNLGRQINCQGRLYEAGKKKAVPRNLWSALPTYLLYILRCI